VETSQAGVNIASKVKASMKGGSDVATKRQAEPVVVFWPFFQRRPSADQAQGINSNREYRVSSAVTGVRRSKASARRP